MTHGEKMLDAVRKSFDAVDKLCMLSEDERLNLQYTFDMLPEKAVERMVRGGLVRLDNDTEISEDKKLARVVGPESELNGTPGVMKMSVNYENLGIFVQDSLEIICEAEPKRNTKTEVLCYAFFDFEAFRRKYRSVYIDVDQNGNASVSEELYDNARPRAFTSSDYRKSYENE